MAGVFLSYARKDGEAQAADLRDRLKRKAPRHRHQTGPRLARRRRRLVEPDENSPAIKKGIVCESRPNLGTEDQPAPCRVHVMSSRTETNS